MRLPGQTTWSAGMCVGHVGPRSYVVKVGETQYRRNRRQLIQANEPLPINLSPTDPPVVDSPVSNSQTSQPPNDIDISGHDQPQTVMLPSITTGNDSSPRRSGRTPKWMDDYVPS